MKRDLYESFFNNKKVTVLGLGLLGRGIGDTAFLASSGAELIVTDKKTKEELATSVEALKEYENITYVLGEHRLQDFENRDFIIKAAGVPLESEYIMYARAHDIPVYMSAALVCHLVKQYCEGVTIIGVTGTRGKTMTTELIAYILEKNGKRVHRGGNIRGVANLPLLEAVEDGDYLVLELDSWQLQGFGDLHISPDIAVFTSFLDDHLNYYHGDRSLYFKDKSQIFVNQTKSCLITSAQAEQEIHAYLPEQACIVPSVGDYESKIIGSHNDVAISLALEVAARCDISFADATEAVITFSGVAGRLENIGMFRGITVYNDNNATTPDATIAGIEAVYKQHKVQPILIMGGADKNLSLDVLESVVREKTKEYILLAGTGTDKLSLSKEHVYQTLEDCVKVAFDHARDGDVILFSPGFASFSTHFRNEYERNDLFVAEVQKYA